MHLLAGEVLVAAVHIAHSRLRVQRVFADRAGIVRLRRKNAGSLHLSHLILVAEECSHQKTGRDLGQAVLLITENDIVLRTELSDGRQLQLTGKILGFLEFHLAERRVLLH